MSYKHPVTGLVARARTGAGRGMRWSKRYAPLI